MTSRRTFFATVAAALATPKALKLVPAADPFFGIDRTFAPPLKPEGLAAWLPDPPPMGRMEMLVSFHEDGLITDADLMRLAAPD